MKPPITYTSYPRGGTGRLKDIDGKTIAALVREKDADQIVQALNAQHPCQQAEEDLIAHWEEYLEVGEDVKPLLDKAIRQAAARIVELEVEKLDRERKDLAALGKGKKNEAEISGS